MACSPIRNSVYRTNSQRLNNSVTQSQRHFVHSSTETSSCDDEHKRSIENQNCGITRRYTISGSRKNFFPNKSISYSSNNGSLLSASAPLPKLDDTEDNKDESVDEDGDGKLFVPARRRI